MSALTRPDFSVRFVAIVLAASFATFVLALGVIFWLYPGAQIDRAARPGDFGAPRLEVRPVEDYDAWRAEQAALLEGAKDRIPIADAMAQVAARGAAGFDPLPGAGGGGQ